jgi:hypothetical protein
MPESCAGSVPGVAPAAIVPAETAEDLPVGSSDQRLALAEPYSIRGCSPGLVFDPKRLTCDYPGLT